MIGGRGRRQARVPGRRRVLAAHVERFPAPVGLDEGHDLAELVDAVRRLRERQAEGPVLGLAPARAEAELESAVGQQVEGGRLLGEHGRHVVVDAEDAAADAERVRARGGHRHGGDWRQVLRWPAGLALSGPGAEIVVSQEQRRVPEVLH
jgi:predicted methyltransferase MtxX (methanogen marker protein 4)